MNFVNPATMRVGDLYFIVALKLNDDQSLASIVRLAVLVMSKDTNNDRLQVKIAYRVKGYIKERPLAQYEYLIDLSQNAKMIGMDAIAVFDTGAEAMSFNRHISDIMHVFNVGSLPSHEAVRLLKVAFFRNFNSGV